jgi:hypothetical protein
LLLGVLRGSVRSALLHWGFHNAGRISAGPYASDIVSKWEDCSGHSQAPEELQAQNAAAGQILRRFSTVGPFFP